MLRHLSALCHSPKPLHLGATCESALYSHTMHEQPHLPEQPPLLEGLQEYRDKQMSRIKKLIDLRFAFSDVPPEDKIFIKFRDSLWGKGLLHLQDPLSNGQRSVVQTPHDKTPRALSLPGGKILERSEYKEAEQAILWANKSHCDAFIVTGHPGIGSPPFPSLSVEPNLESGKTVFLVWLLMRRLALELPTAIQVSSGQAILFHKHGTSQFSRLEKIETYRNLMFSDPLEKLWVLVDSNQDLLDPAPVFRYHGPFFVVEALCPCALREEWTKKVSRQYFYMKTWTRLEVQQASVTPLFDSS